ncbi:bifunctional 3-(3-hydroxy-phenyl)propionate/3-hydroxycinnamic acid hydroxylase [Pseudarthrobacter psychrotolerans]|uniref:Bifunctional 3-(3-hydroxy-phenyl)propionate/3-hydroxycinnamic acid hydroxylase n=1 Tax=Pseudarthrobacter psychrotolerans TaxID=2697569 RepID=A0A6P1NNW0_9MICC|nr:bifunctional 3-(3-hydroxy-phenyl)propionate/3-hydroxycinnamic acid hydroxylase [Pseudarthrobacter psychrotolerans]
MPEAAVTARVHDVAIVGLGPVGQVLALLLAQQGNDVVVVEKQTEPYPLPRAVHYDGDISRVLDGLGLADFMAEFSSASDIYEWQNAARETLLQFRFPMEGSQGWPESTMFNQPTLEGRLRQRAGEFPNIRVLRGTEVVGVEQGEDHATLAITSPTLKHKKLRARYVVGCDGAKSFIRQYMNTAVTDLGFFYDWLIVDILPQEAREWTPDNLQVCDPVRPTSAVNGGPGRRRFEFMRMPQDNLTTFDTDQTAWALLEPWGITPANAALERRALYTFQARFASAWRDGRLFLAGDAAHQMPPFFGQGMVSGVRDAVNLGWKLDLVLRGAAADVLLDTYDSECSAHVQHAIGMSVELGKVICETDPAAVAARDAHFLAKGPDPVSALPPIPPERLGRGVVPGGEPLASPVAGIIGMQARVTFPDGVTDLLDRRTFGSFTLICDGSAVSQQAAVELSDCFPAGVPGWVVRVLPAGSALPADVRTESTTAAPGGVLTVADAGGRYLDYLAGYGHIAQLFRPDFYIYDGAADLAELHSLITGLGDSLNSTETELSRSTAP